MNVRLWLVPVLVGLFTPAVPRAQSGASSDEITFTKDIAPILQRSCQRCHRPDGVAPMPLVTYEQVRPWAREIRVRTSMGPQAGVMPPWFVEKDIGIQKFKDDPSLSDEEIALIAKWVNSGAPRGNPIDMPPPLHFDESDKWTIGEPDLVLKSKEVTVLATGPDWWGDVGLIPTGLTEDKYVSAVEVREVNDIPKGGATKTVGGRYAFHHMTYSSIVPGQRDSSGADENATTWPIHEVGRNADIFPPEAGRLLAANSSLSLTAGHIHSNGRETKAHLEFAFKFFPAGYKPLYRRSTLRLGNGIDIDVKPKSGEAGASRLRHAGGEHEDHRIRTSPACAWRTHVSRSDLGSQHPDAELRRLRPQLGEAICVRGRCGAAPAEGHDRSSHWFPRHHR
jgi:hypothetical protein